MLSLVHDVIEQNRTTFGKTRNHLPHLWIGHHYLEHNMTLPFLLILSRYKSFTHCGLHECVLDQRTKLSLI